MAYVPDKLPNTMDNSTLIEFSQEPSILAPFLYDAIVSLDMAICQAMTNATGTADEIMKEFQPLNFIGASGPIQVPPPHWNPPLQQFCCVESTKNCTVEDNQQIFDIVQVGSIVYARASNAATFNLS
jgi:hypothetical protein